MGYYDDSLLQKKRSLSSVISGDTLVNTIEKPNEKKPKKGKFIKNSKDLLFLIVLLSVEFIVNSGVALMVPFFPIAVSIIKY